MNEASKIYVAGHNGLVGSALVRELNQQGFKNIIVRTSGEMDLRRQSSVDDFFKSNRPEIVFLAAAKVGGILANDRYPADFIGGNLQIQSNVIDASFRFGVKRFVFLGSSCVYPRKCPQPIREEYLLTSSLEPTNEAYAVAKIAGIKMCQAYRRQHGFNAISLMPSNLYGPADNFDLSTSHVLPALIRKFHEAKVHSNRKVTIWGTGTPRREFLYVDDLARACISLARSECEFDLINVGVGADVSISELAKIIQGVVGFKGEMVFDTSKPDGTPQKLLDTSRLARFGWKPAVSLSEGIECTYNWYLSSVFESAQQTVS